MEIQLQRGVPEARVVEWLEWLRRNGEDYSFLRTLPEFSSLEDSALKHIADATDFITCANGKPIFRKGEAGDAPPW